MYRLAALDLDGTLVDSAPDLAHCLGVALASEDLAAPSVEQCRGWVGDGVDVLVRRGLAAGLRETPDGAVAARVLAVFDRCYRARLFVESRLYPEVAATLESLRANGVIVGCITNKRETYALALLEQAGIGRHLDFVYGGDSLSAKKPGPLQLISAARRFGISPGEAVMVGDSTNDSRAAESAGFDFVFAAYGYAGIDAAALAQSPLRIEAFSELKKLLCRP